jgi:hypothetical protein
MYRCWRCPHQCQNHSFPVKHLFKDCDLPKCYLKGELALASKGKWSKPSEGKKEDDTFLRPEGCLMISSGPAAY